MHVSVGLVGRVESCGSAMRIFTEPGAGISLDARIPIDVTQQRGIEPNTMP
jgi:hypothetical protein